MKLFTVYNGWMANTDVNVQVIAESEERALEIASKKFKEDATQPGGTTRYNETYWTRLEAHVEAEDTSKEWCSEVNE